MSDLALLVFPFEIFKQDICSKPEKRKKKRDCLPVNFEG